MPALVRAAIERAQRISALEDDWDDEGSPGYARETVEEAVNTAVSVAAALPQQRRKQIKTLSFVPGPVGSVDVELVLGDRRLLINVPPALNEEVLYYGHGPERSSPIKGSFDRGNRLRFLAEWLLA